MSEYKMFRIRIEDHKKLKMLSAQRSESMLDTFSAALGSLSLAKDLWQKDAKKLYLEQGKKIEAIKLCHRVTGLSLGAARKAVEALKEDG